MSLVFFSRSESTTTRNKWHDLCDLKNPSYGCAGEDLPSTLHLTMEYELALVDLRMQSSQMVFESQ